MNLHFDKLYYNFNRYPPSLYKTLCSAYDLSKKDAIIWGMTQEPVAIEKYRQFGDATVEETGKEMRILTISKNFSFHINE